MTHQSTLSESQTIGNLTTKVMMMMMMMMMMMTTFRLSLKVKNTLTDTLLKMT
jgi:hypothetical protein